jgi:hypothetical protein
MDEATGRAKGGVARADALSSDQRTEIAKKAAAARWAPDIPQATHTGTLNIGGADIPCAVLPDGTRLLTQAGFLGALGRSTKPKGRSQQVADGLPPFLSTISLKPLITQDIIDTTVPVIFRTESGARAQGYKAELLPKVCNLFLSARDQGLLTAQQQDIATKCDILVRGLAEVGIIALVDEVTGFQRDRAADSLSKILEAFIARELQPWLKTFPSDFYQEMFRLRGMQYPNDTVQRPRYFGLFTNDIVYDRLAPGVLDELRKVNPKGETGRRKHKNFQWLTNNVGYPKLREHLGSVVAIMKLSSDWYDFRAKLDKLHPRYGKPTQLALEFADDDEPDTGKGL